MMQRSSLKSAAGNIKFTTIRSSPTKLPNAQLSVSVFENNKKEIVILPNPEKLENPNEHLAKADFEYVEIDDVMCFSKQAILAEAPIIEIVKSTKTDLDEIYVSTPPFDISNKSAKGNKIVNLVHPLQNRKRAIIPKIKILGIPDEW
ncbi:hypothetical protein TRFO_12319 [Tritrichomonas foetus]|uniref:Uncharacterized protein n=1 Tax=Tritrichomonas foetus TaxID=1144522 RepID=A0A1J4J537_9EUKA|nr:hypothetical protein TRFO_12319 [Tritrichomonas foetus]|eukprot:OHS92763.1 hypothetical protein TRFO_12319 [Tritrichomonas foetus]